MSLLKWMCESSRSAFREAKDLTRPNLPRSKIEASKAGGLGLAGSCKLSSRKTRQTWTSEITLWLDYGGFGPSWN